VRCLRRQAGHCGGAMCVAHEEQVSWRYSGKVGQTMARLRQGRAGTAVHFAETATASFSLR
jgi:hypothetical protein